MKKAVFCLATSDEQTRRIVDHLFSSGFRHEEISILYPDHSRETFRNSEEGGDVEYRETSTDSTQFRKGGLTTEKHSKLPEGAATGGTAGGILGGSLGLLAGIGALSIPGLGAFIAAGPIMAALSGSAVGGSLGLLIGAIIGAGIPEYEAKKYQDGLKKGNILISVHTNSGEQITQAKDIMKKEGGKDISATTETVQTRH